MTSYLSGWFGSGSISQRVPSLRAEPPVISVEQDSDDETVNGDKAPAFPSLNSIQRARSDAKLMPPPTFKVTSPSLDSSLMPPPTTTTKPKPRSKKVALSPGHSPLDWARLKSSGSDLRGVDALLRVTPSMLKQHRTRDDAWSCFNGKVYNITPYLPFHPGGEKELLRVAGRDGTKLFAATHAWVNVDFMLDACFIGFLVPEPVS